MNNSQITILIILIICIFLSAFFSCIETAFSCINTIRLKRNAENGDKKALKALYIIDRFDKALTTILIGNNIVNLGGTSLATVLCVDLFGDAGAAIATGATTFLVLTFGEIVPKCIGKEKSDAISYATAGILKFLMIILYPLVWFFTHIKTIILKLAKIKNTSPSVTEAELKYIVESIEEEGILEEQESEMVQSALAFDDKSADEILTPRVDLTAIDINDDSGKINSVIIKERFSRIPVYEDNLDNIIGILHTRDYLEEISLGKIPDIRKLIQKPYFIYKSQKLSSILSEFKKNKLHIAVVADEYGGTLGIVTMEDLIEEIVGDIWDEDEEVEKIFTKLSENKYLVSGDMELEELFDLFEINQNLLDSESVTVGGLILEKIGAIPKKEQSIQSYGLKITVSEVSDTRVTWAIIEKASTT